MLYLHSGKSVASLLSLGILLLCVSCEPSNSTEQPTHEASSESIVSTERVGDSTVDAGTEPFVSRETKPESMDVTPSQKPNILLIIADDFGTDVFLPYNDADRDGKADDNRSYAPTPHLQSICRQGVQFSQAWATPLCSSTRSTILTGQFGFRTGIGEAIPRAEGIAPNTPTIPALLTKTSRYQHANIGKWHLGTSTALGGDKAPNTMGWSHYSGSLSGELKDYSQWTKVTNGVSSTSNTYATSENVNDAIGWLEKRDTSKPWLLWLAFNAPHNPLHLPPSGLHSASGLTGRTPDIRKKGPAYYRAMVEAVDTEIGRLIKWLKDNKQYDNTMIVFIGDNGTQNVAVEPPYDGKRSKGTVYQNGIHVPLCISGAMVKQGGRVSTALVHSVDLFATILHATGAAWKSSLPTGHTLDSKSLLPILQASNAAPTRTWNYSERFKWGTPNVGTFTIRNKTYKIVRVTDTNGSHKDQFYDLGKDPREESDLLANGSDKLTPTQATEYQALLSTLSTLRKP